MTADAFALEWLARAGAGGLVFLLAAAVAVRLCRQPADRVRVTSVALLGAVLVPWFALLPGLPRLSVAVLPAAPAAVEPTVEPADAGDEAAPVGRPWSPAVEPVAVAKEAPASVNEQPADAGRSPEPVAAAVAPEQPADAGRSPEPVAASASGWSVGSLVVAGYALATLALAGWSGLGLWRLHRLRRAARPAPAEAVALLRGVAGPAADRVELLVSDRLDSPVALPGRRPAIVLPAADTDPAAVRFALAHEWSHVERGDLGRWCLTTFAQIVLFYQPLFWWLRRQLRLSQDYLADARAAAAGDPADYAAYLVALARRRSAAPALALGVADRRSHLTRRVHMLLLSPEPPRPHCRRLWTAGVALVAVGLLAGLSAVRLTAADEKPAAKDEPKPDATKPAAKDAPKGETLNYFGVVVDKDTKKPIAGASVVVRRSTSNARKVLEESKHTTGKFGTYTFTVPPEQSSRSDLYIELDVEHPEYAPAKGFGYSLAMIRKNQTLGGKPFFESVELRPGKPVTGVVHTPDGKPAAGVKVMAYSVTSKKAPGEFEYGSFADTKTDQDGKYRLTLTTPGWAVLWVLPEQFVPSTRVLNDKRGDLGTYTLKDGPRLTGKVLDAQGKPVAGVAVNAESQDRNDEITEPVADNINRSATTDANGEFAMAPLPPGNYLVKPDEHPRDASLGRPTPYDRAAPVPGVFVGTKVALKADAKPDPVEVRAVPHVTVEGQYFDSKGQKCKGFGPHVFGRLDGVFWHAEAKCKDGKFVCHVPHGLEEASLDLITNEHHALRWRKKAGEPLSNSRTVRLGTLTDDATGLEVVSYDAPILLVKVTAPAGVTPKDLGIVARLKGGRQGDGAFVVAGGRPSDVSFEKQEDGRFRSSQLFPDEELTVTAQAAGWASKPVTLTLAEGTTKEVELTLEPAKEEAKDGEKK